MLAEKRSHKKLLVYLLVVLSLALVYYVGSMRSWAWYLSPGMKRCLTPKKELHDLKELAKDCHLILEKFHLTNILIYGSLWGAVRYSNPIPWDNDLDIALLSNEMRLVDHNALYQEFQMKNISIYYRAWFGTYRVTRATARGDLMVFRETYFGEMSRTGIESWVCFLNHRNYHMFPSRLFKIPLPMLPFADVNFSVPRGGIEIQKHFYPNDWWKENKLDDC